MNKQERMKIAIDLTPLRPGGVNGGAKTLVVTLLREFANYRTDAFEYLLIAEPWNYEELKGYQADNIVCSLKSELFAPSTPFPTPAVQPVAKPPMSLRLRIEFWGRRCIGLLKYVAKKLLSRFPAVREKLKTKILSTKQSVGRLAERSDQVLSTVLPKTGVLQEQYDVDLLFCPFSAPTFAENGLPLVAIAYDLQHLDLPFFFKINERLHRTQFLKDLLRKATKVVCISEFTRQSFVAHLDASTEQLMAIPICIHERLRKMPLDYVSSVLTERDLDNKRYLFFPANFWPHKNHRLLLAAYSIYKQQFADQALDLVFTGALEEPQATLKNFVRGLGYEKNVHFLGFLDEDELIAIWQGSQGLIFPSLYEGFGIPLLEAMWFDKPVACSSIGSLPEVGGDSVIYFDPRRPEDVAHAMAQLGNNLDLNTQLREKAKGRLQYFKKQHMTEKYLNVFEAALAAQ